MAHQRSKERAKRVVKALPNLTQVCWTRVMRLSSDSCPRSSTMFSTRDGKISTATLIPRSPSSSSSCLLSMHNVVKLSSSRSATFSQSKSRDSKTSRLRLSNAMSSSSLKSKKSLTSRKNLSLKKQSLRDSSTSATALSCAYRAASNLPCLLSLNSRCKITSSKSSSIWILSSPR